MPESAVSWLANKTLDKAKYSQSSKFTNVVAGDSIPEVLEFGKIVHDINKDYYTKSIAVLVKSMEETTGALLSTNCLTTVYHSRFQSTNTSNSMLGLARRFICDSKTTGGRRMLGTGPLIDGLPTLDYDHIQPLAESLETLIGIVHELQEAMI